MSTILLGIAELNVAKAPDILATLGLGSCVGLVLYDAVNKIGGMAHIMLPMAPAGEEPANKAKYANTAIDELLKKIAGIGAKKFALTAKLAGGAHMFGSSASSDIMKVGERNIEVCRQILDQLNIRIAGEETGGNVGRTIEFDCGTGLLSIKTAWPKTIKTI